MRRLRRLSPLAVRWLQIRAAARAEPERPAEAGDRATAPGRAGPALWSLARHDDAGHLLDGGGTPGGLAFHALMMGLRDGAPSGKAGSLCTPFLRAFTLLLSSVCKMWVRIRRERWGLRAAIMVICDKVPTYVRI
jgi:hypothetical protein